MNKDKEPLLSAKDWFIENKNMILNKSDEKFINAYAKYHTEWHLNNEKWYSDSDMDKAYDKGFKDAMFKYRE